MKLKTSTLTGPALDWAVAKCEGRESTFGHGFAAKFAFYPSKRWSQGGPIIEREGITLRRGHSGWWIACRLDINDYEQFMAISPTPLIAAMRCYVASKLGDEVDVPEELA